ncbi:helix-turn-helix domain-containing protein [Asanoa sp. NPDC050611]|uniref:helix-turn-helix domain-containing protein n=1 Tax=Asanoa sp. NPDC050611 TaxID=3157098 RepID=UPI0033D8A679
MLAPFVASIGCYEADVPDGRETTVPTGAAQIVVNLDRDELSWHSGGKRHTRGGIGFCPPQARPLEIDTAQQRRTICVAFRPGGAYPFVGPVDALDEPVIDLDELWGRTFLRERLQAAASPRAALRLVEEELAGRLAHPPDPGLAAAAADLGRGLAVAAVGITTGADRRRFAAQVGLSPKRFARVRRLQRLLDTVGPDRDWARAAVEVGYFDQAHMVNDFRALTGLTPTAYEPRSAGERNHVRLPAAPRSAPR